MYSLIRHLPALLWKQRPIQLTYFVTRRCNAHCPYCFYLASQDNPQTDEEELTLDEIRHIAGSMGTLMWLAFSGGEIFLRKDLADISRIFYRHNRPCIMLYPTNGMLPKLIRQAMEQILMECPNSVIVVKLSIDGIGERHDQVRNTANSFARTMQTFNALTPLLDQYQNFELGFNTVFSSENQHEMDSIIDFVAKLEHAPLHTISMVRGKLNSPHYKTVDYAKYAQAVARLASNMQNRRTSLYRFNGARLKAAQDVLQRKLIHRTLVEQQRQIPCYAGRSNLVLYETGEVTPCEMLSRSFGNVRDHEYDMQKVIQTRKAQNSLASIKAKCCFCSHECYMMTNTLLNPRLYPALGKEYLQINRACSG